MKILRWNKLSIQTFISIAYAVVIVILVTVIGVISYTVTSRTVEENTNEYVFQLVKQINYDIEYYMKNIEDTLNSVMASDDVIAYFSEEMGRTEDELVTLSEELSGYMVSREDIINIFLAREDGQIVINEGDYTVKPGLDFRSEDWYTGTIKQTGTVISNSHIQNMIVDRYKWVVSLGSMMNHPITDEAEGVVLVDLNFNLIDDMVANLSLGDKGYLFIIDAEGDIIYHPKHELIYSGIRSEDIDKILASEDGYVSSTEDFRAKNYIVVTSSYTGWKVVGAVYEDELKPYDLLTRQIYFLISGLSIVLAILLSIFISRHYLHPIKDLSDGMERFKNGDLDATVEVAMENEFGELAEDFNDMTVRIKSLVKENQLKEKAKRKFELKSLQSQINPHFLYNTLDSIVWMAEAGMNEEVVKMTFSLSKLFRIGINRGSEFITLEQELEHIESYLAIQKIRYGEKLDYSIDADPSLLSCRIIKIIIQPVVENAIYHGIKKLPGTGFIDIKVREQNGNICITVEDDGVGMDEETALHLVRKTDNSTGGSGIGLANVDQRIKLYYGEEYGVKIESVEFEGTKVTLTIAKEFPEEVSEDEA